MNPLRSSCQMLSKVGQPGDAEVARDRPPLAGNLRQALHFRGERVQVALRVADKRPLGHRVGTRRPAGARGRGWSLLLGRRHVHSLYTRAPKCQARDITGFGPLPCAYILIDDKYQKDYSRFMRDSSMLTTASGTTTWCAARPVGAADARRAADSSVAMSTKHSAGPPLRPLPVPQCARPAHGEYPWRSRRPRSRVPGTVQLATLERKPMQTTTDPPPDRIAAAKRPGEPRRQARRGTRGEIR
jgi:hypothetical protein